MSEFKAPFFTREQIEESAEVFLLEFHPTRTIPVPIETMVERMGIDIVPVPGLQAAYDVDAYTTSDLREIHVEEFVYLNRPTRYRFTLAHEVGHIRLHGGLFGSLAFQSGDEWKTFVGSIPERDYRYLEYHANEFAGRVLMPRAELLRDVETCKQTILEHIPEAPQDPDAYRDFIAACIAKGFDVSHQAALTRLNKEGVVVP